MRDRRRQRVVLRRSRVRYQWNAVFQSLAFLIRWTVFFGAAVWAAIMAHGFWTQSPRLRVKGVQVDPAAPAGFAKALTVKPGDHLFAFSPRLVSLRMRESFPELSDVRVSRRWNGSVKIRVHRREPVARVFDGRDWFGMDASGALFPLRERADAASGLPVVAGLTGPAAAPLLEFIGRLKQEASWARGMQKVKAVSPENVFLFLADGTPVYWGEIPGNPEVRRKKAARLERVLKDDALARGAESIRFIDDNRLAVKPKSDPLPAPRGTARP